jgi:hypothetical protein
VFVRDYAGIHAAGFYGSFFYLILRFFRGGIGCLKVLKLFGEQRVEMGIELNKLGLPESLTIQNWLLCLGDITDRGDRIRLLTVCRFVSI